MRSTTERSFDLSNPECDAAGDGEGGGGGEGGKGAGGEGSCARGAASRGGGPPPLASLVAARLTYVLGTERSFPSVAMN